VRPILTGDNPTSTTWVSSCSHAFNSNPSLVNFGSSKYVTWDNFELTGVCWTNTVANAGFVNIDRSSTTNISITNFYCHGWTMTDTAYDNYVCVQSFGSTGNTNDGSRIGYSVFDGSDSPHAFPGTSSCLYQGSSVPCASGQADQGGMATFDHNVMRYLSNFIVSTDTTSVHDNLFEYLAQTFSGGLQQHGNIINDLGCDTGQPTYWYNNITRHTYSTQLVYLPVCTTAYIFGNVFYDDLIGYGSGGCFRLNSVSNSAATQTAYLYGNTMGDASCQFKFELANSPLTPWNGTGNFENNHIIGSTTLAGMYVCNTTATCTINDNGHEIYMTTGTATSQGYVAGNNYAPTLMTNSTVGAGANITASCSLFSTDNAFCNGTTGTLEASGSGGQIVTSPGITLVARPSSGAWDSGAYEFSGGGGGGGTQCNLCPGIVVMKGVKIQ
jgi:hypothetical protein